MPSPCINQLFIQIFSLVYCFISCLIIFCGIKLDSTVSRRHHMNNALVSTVSQLDGGPACFIK